jgi:hypothetical protein
MNSQGRKKGGVGTAKGGRREGLELKNRQCRRALVVPEKHDRSRILGGKGGADVGVKEGQGPRLTWECL